MKKIRTHYDNLKVPSGSSAEAIRSAYKKLSQKHHPDRNENSPESHRVMKIINESYTVLSDPDRRKNHDAWIQQQESLEPHAEHDFIYTQTEFHRSAPGEIQFSDLDEAARKNLLERVSGVNRNQYAIQLDDVLWNYAWICALSVWFYYLYASATNLRWSIETTFWYAGITGGVTFLLARNISWVYSWHTTPLKSWLLVTPLYLMRLHLDRITYWPIWTISNITATDNYRNGSYQDTSVSITVEGKQQIFSIFPEEAYQLLLAKLKEYDQHFMAAVNSNDLPYIRSNDDFLNMRNRNRKQSSSNFVSTVVIYIAVMLFSAGFMCVAYDLNQDHPVSAVQSESKTLTVKTNSIVPEHSSTGVSYSVGALGVNFSNP